MAASVACKAEGAHHADIHSSAENDFVRRLAPSTIIGVTFGYKRDSDGNFIWDRTNEHGSYRNWNTGEPNNANGGEGCGFMYISDLQRIGKWNDVPCSDEFAFVCKKGKLILGEGLVQPKHCCCPSMCRKILDFLCSVGLKKVSVWRSHSIVENARKSCTWQWASGHIRSRSEECIWRVLGG